MKKNVLLLVCISFFIIIPSNVNGQSKYHEYVIGIHSGYSFLLGGGLRESGGLYSECKEETKLGLHGGLSLRCYFSAKYAVQLEMDYQRRTVHEERTDFVNPEYSYSRVDNDSFTVCYLNLIREATHKRNKSLSWYISAGIGVGKLSPHVLYFKIGNGMRYYFSPHMALHLGVSFSPAQLIRLVPVGMMYFSLNVGLEYGF